VRTQDLEAPSPEVAKDEVVKSQSEAWRKHVAEPQGGSGSRPADTRHTFGGFNTPLISHVSGTWEIRE
jgi:hypothetical protein